MLDYKAMYRRAGEIFKELKSETRPRDLVKQMSGGQRQAVAIARTMLSEAKIVLMDEPTAAISVRQVAEVLNLIRHLRDRGIAVVLISHRMPDVFTVADRVIVMRRGRKVADKPIAASSPEEVTGLITGAIEQVMIDARVTIARNEGRRWQSPLIRRSTRSSRAGFRRYSGSQTFWVLLAVILACIFLSFATNSFATTKNLYNITRNVTFVAIIALGMTMVIITGGIDLSVGSVLCLCSMVLAVVMHAGYSIEVGIAASIGTALVVGAFNGVLIAYLGFPPFVVTLGMLSIARSLAMVASNNTVVFQFGPDHDKLLALGGGAWFFGIANPVLYMIVLALLTGFVLRWTKFGRHIFAIGGNEHAATLTGVPVRPIKVAVYMISALSAGIAGIIQTGWLGAVTTNIGAGMELQVIAAAVIGGANLAGGVGTAFGALIGAALIEVIRNSLGLLGINAFWQGTFIGGAIMLAVLFDRVRNFRQSE